MLAEFKYGLEPKESFSEFFDQTKSNRSANLLASNDLSDSQLIPVSLDFSIISKR